MKADLEYKELQRSEIGAWKHGNLYVRRSYCKEAGGALARAGIFKHGTPDAAKVLSVFVNTFIGTGFIAIKFLGAIVGQGVIDSIRRDMDRFESGHWVKLPWATENWFQQSPYRYLHSAHIPREEKNHGKVVFAENINKLERDIFTPMNPGRYLTRFFSDVLSEADIKLWSEKYAALFKPADLHFVESNDPDGWVQVYAEGPQSCMKGEDRVRVYAHDKSVLRLAYMTRGNEIINRAIVREDTTPKEYIRVYPANDSVEHTLLREALESQGYVAGGLKGVLLDAIEYDEGGDTGWVCPYLDGGTGDNSAVALNVVHMNGGTYLKVVRSGDFDGQTQNGFVGESGVVCDDCGDREDEDDIVYVEHGDYSICQRCYDNNYVTAIGRSHEIVMRAEDAVYCESDGSYYDPDYASYHDVYECEESGNYYKIDDLVSTSRGYIHTDYAEQLDVDDDDGNNYAHKDDVVTTHDGRTIHKDDAILRTVYFHKDDDIENDQTPNDVTNVNAA